jgi:uncharacterized protein YkwD
MIKFLKILCLVLFIKTGFAVAQDLSNEVHLLLPDLPRLEWLTYEAVNNLRSDNGLSKLDWDHVLYRAALDHANYLINEKRISHEQKLPGKRYPLDRVKIHGGFIYDLV